MKTLDVYLHEYMVGHLIQDEHGQMVFDYAESWLDNPIAIPLSNSLPLRKERFTRNECRGFFAGVLPEEGKREIIARNLGISARNDFSMLEEIGGECAGAVTFMLSGEVLPEQNRSYRSLTDESLEEILKQLPRRPLMAGEKEIRLSLAGVQDKIAVRLVDDNIFIPLGGAPSTHILKPAIDRFEGTVFNEAFCMQLASFCGFHVAKVEIGKTGSIDYLLVERYDRHDKKKFVPIPNSETMARVTVTERIHQEDFCQALGIVAENKYQKESGPSLKQCFALLRELSSRPAIDLQHLLDAVIFNFFIGNNDAHGKNFSLLYLHLDTLITGGLSRLDCRFAPLYDLVCTTYYPELDKKMAMKIGGEYDSDKITPKHFEKLAEEAGLSRPMVKRRVVELANSVMAKIDTVPQDHPVASAVAELVRQRCAKVLTFFT